MKDDDRLKLASRLLIGGIAGIVGTMAMTSAIRRLHRPAPSEIADPGSGSPGEPRADETSRDSATAAQFVYGAAMGAMISALNPDPARRTGAAAGLALWLAGYMGWIPPMGAPEPATKGPARRSLKRIAAHLAWGWATAGAIRELRAARETIFKNGPDRDAPR